MRAYIIATLLALSTGCLSAEDTGPVLWSELEGQWCSDATAPLGTTCLEVRLDTSYNSRYIWTTHTPSNCTETGVLTGGLEFSPDTATRLCLAPDASLYSASAEWSATGLRLELDASPSALRAAGNGETVVLELHYRP